MKTSLHAFKGIFRLTVIALILTSTTVFAQDELIELPSEFKISIESSKKALKLLCIKGCNWKELHFRTTSDNILQAVNRYGMIDLTQRDVIQNDETNDFLFTIETSENSIRLKGMEGTAWTELTFDCFDLKCIRTIDAYGIARYKR
jgi:hypothetical protein